MFLLTKNYREEEKTNGEKLREIDFYFLLRCWGSTPGIYSATLAESPHWSTVHGYVVDNHCIYPGLTSFNIFLIF